MGQSLFFDNMENSIWTTDSSFNESTFSKTQEIELIKLKVSKDSIKTDRVIWTFEDSLIVTFYNAVSKQEKIIGKYKYEHDKVNELLLITIDEEEPLAYTVGIVSTGSYVLLMKKKEKKKKTRTPNKG